MADKRVRALLTIILDKQSAQKMRQDLNKLEKQLEEIEKQTDDLAEQSKALEKALAEATDDKQADELAKALGKVQDQLKKTTARADELSESIQGGVDSAVQDAEQRISQMREAADQFQTIGESIAVGGAAIIAPMVLAAQSYIDYAGQADEASREWLDSQKRLEQSQRRVGRVAAQVILPVLEKVADISERAAAFAEKNPDAVKAVMGLGAGLVGVGGFVALAGKGIKLALDAKSLAMFVMQSKAAKQMWQAAQAQLQAARTGGAGRAAGYAAVGVGAVVAGGTIGGAIADAIGPVLFDEETWKKYRGDRGIWEQAAQNLRQVAVVWVDFTSNIGESVFRMLGLKGVADTYGDIADKFILSIAGISDATVEAADRLAASAPMFSQEAVDTFADYRQTTIEAEEDYLAERQAIIDRHGEQRTKQIEALAKQQDKARETFDKNETKLLEKHQQDMAKATDDFHKANREAEEQYHKERADAARENGVETLRAEEDHRRAMKRLEDDYNTRQLDAIADRNFDAFIANEREYERERQQSEEDFTLEQTRRSEDFAAQMAEMDANFAAQKQARLVDYQDRILEMQTNFAQQKAERALQFEEQMTEQREQHLAELAESEAAKEEELKALDEAYAAQQAELEESLARQLASLDQNLLGEEEARKAHYARMTGDLETWLELNARKWREGLYSMQAQPGTAGAPQVTATVATPATGTSAGRGIIGGRQGGGYITQRGAYDMAESGREFVLDNPTTRALESLSGQRLTQERILSGMTTHRIETSGPYAQDLLPMVKAAAMDALDNVIVEIERGRE